MVDAGKDHSRSRSPSLSRPPVSWNMPERGHRIYGTTTARLSLVIHAPSRYVYDWCTDYRSDDSRLSSRRPAPRYRVIRISPRRVVRIRVVTGSGRDPLIAVDMIRLNPPRSWHLDQIDETDRQALDYRVTSVGRERTRLHLLTTERWVTPNFPTPKELRAQVARTWARLAAALEADYRAGRPARGR
jgi:hypothetical protein